MSYILDALKRADAERERGAVPGLHAQPAALPLPDEPGTAALPPWAWGLGGLGLALVGMLVWSLWRDDPATAAPQSPPPQATAPARDQAPSTPNGLLPPQQTDRLPQGEARPARREPTPQARVPQQHDAHDTRDEAKAAPADAPPARQAAKPSDAPVAADSARTSTSTSTRTSTRATPRTAPVAEAEAPAGRTTPAQDITAPPTPRVLTQHELPDHVRRQLPTLVIGGAMYSENPANRMLVINSQLFHEGDKLGQDLTLEEIKLKSAVLRFQRWRYSVNY